MLQDNWEDENYDQDINVDTQRTIKRAAKDYPCNLAVALIREWGQNSVDGWTTNIYEREVIGDRVQNRPKLNITFECDTNTQSLVMKDNAGGMTKNILKNKFTGMNTPGVEKIEGDQAGSEGRGFYVISNSVDSETGVVYAQTLHESGYIYQTSVNINRGKKTGIKTIDKSESVLDSMGTAIIIPNVMDDVFNKIKDPEFFRNTFEKWFWNLFNNYNVEAELIVDGETIEKITDSRLKFTEEAKIDEHTNFEKFQSHGKSGYVDRVSLYNKQEINSSDIPFDGTVALLKGNKHLNEPYMMIKDYDPNKIPAVRRNKVVGYADISSLCPQFEERNHMGLAHSIASRSGIREFINNSCRENFDIKDSAKNTEEIESDVRNLVNTVCNETKISGFTDIGEDKKSENKNKDDGIPEPKLVANVKRPEHNHKPGDKVTLISEIREVSNKSRNWLFDKLIVTRDGEKIEELESFDQIQTTGDSCNSKEIYSFTPEEDSKYTIEVVVKEINSNSTKTLNASINLYVGDANPRWSPTTTTTEKEENEETDIIDDVKVMRAEGEPWEYGIIANENGYKAQINSAHPRLKRIDENHSKGQAKIEQKIEFSSIVLEGIKMHQIEQKADENPSEVIKFIENRKNQVQRLRSQIAKEVNNYE